MSYFTFLATAAFYIFIYNYNCSSPKRSYTACTATSGNTSKWKDAHNKGWIKNNGSKKKKKTLKKVQKTQQRWFKEEKNEKPITNIQLQYYMNHATEHTLTGTFSPSHTEESSTSFKNSLVCHFHSYSVLLCFVCFCMNRLWIYFWIHPFLFLLNRVQTDAITKVIFI